MGLTEVGQMIRRKRETLKWTQEHLAAKALISPQYLSRIERERYPDVRTFILLCEWLKIDPSLILGFGESQPLPILTDEDWEYLGEAIKKTIRHSLERISNNERQRENI